MVKWGVQWVASSRATSPWILQDEEDKLDCLCEKLSITNSQGGEEYPTEHKMKEG